MLLKISGKIDKVPDQVLSSVLYDENNGDDKDTIVKLKIRPYDIQDDIYKITKIQNNKNLIRLDGNNLFKSNELSKILENIDCEYIEYIEDSFINQQEEKQFNQLYPNIKIGVDPKDLSFKQQEHQEFVILKPCLMGSISELILKIIELESLNKKVVLSSCFEGDFGHKILNFIYLCDLYKNKRLPGFDTKKHLKKKGTIKGHGKYFYKLPFTRPSPVM